MNRYVEVVEVMPGYKLKIHSSSPHSSLSPRRLFLPDINNFFYYRHQLI